MAAVRSEAPDMLVTTYLHMTSRDQFRAAFASADGVRIVPLPSPDVPFYRFLYGSVGEDWRWRDRLIMSDADLEAVLSRPGTSVDVLYVGDVPAGYVELVNNGWETELAYFGLRPGFTGMGLGKHLLSHSIARAWEADIRRLTVHTCNLDSPRALDNYVKRGFRVYKVHRQPMPERYQ
ncbi:MAG: GNAT family N-acetyltransferase [Anaerolineae bacterium]